MRAITNSVVRRIAEQADVTEQTVVRYLAALPMKGRTKSRIEAALRSLRWTDLLTHKMSKTGTDG